MPSPRILLDCRWLNSGGAGRVTELLLRGLANDPGVARWILWGPPEVEALAWQGTEIVEEIHDPRERNGQKSWFDIPRCDLALFMHQQRPLRRLPSVTMIYDTIPLRFTSGRLARLAKRLFLKRVASISEQVVTTSEYSRRRIATDLRLDESRISVVEIPGDPVMAERVAKLRRAADPRPEALYLGLFLPHKNLQMLIDAFAQTRFHSEGGRLVLMGGSPAEHRALVAGLTAGEHRYVDARPFSRQQDLEEALATCRFLVQPSLEEGFGLPAWEALCCGVPACVSDGGSLPEVTRGHAVEFPARSLECMVEALDVCAERAAGTTPEQAESASDRFLAAAPSIDQFATAMHEIMRHALANRT